MAKIGRKKSGNEKFLVETRLDEIIKSEVMKRRVKGIKATQTDIYEEIAEYVGIATGTVNMIRRGDVNPSVTVSIKIADFFDMRVEEIWQTKKNPNYEDNRERCSEPNCNKLYFSKGLCIRHYNMMKSSEHNRKKRGELL